MPLRFTSDAARTLRRAIREAGGVEVFAIGQVENQRVNAVTVTCRGQEAAVPALLDRPRTGQVVIHNHPSGNLTPSDADMHLAGLYGDDGIGVVIVDSQVSRDNWVVEPHETRVKVVDPELVKHIFTAKMAQTIDGYEPRPGQLSMALQVARALSDDTPFVCEAGTGTGKSLGYLVPAALWALANDSTVVVSTHTKALQDQLCSSDLPKLLEAGLEVRSAVLKGRNNYVCKRRLAIADDEDTDADDTARVELDAVLEWEQITHDGTRADLPITVPHTLWERIESDSDLTLRVRCPHYATCHYYQARRAAAGAHIVVVNHALLLADLAIRELGGKGVLPKYHRVIIDEAHHLEDAATSAIGRRTSLTSLQRATAPLLDRRRRKGALTRLAEGEHQDPLLSELLQPILAKHLDTARARTHALRERAAESLAALAEGLLDVELHPRRLTRALEHDPRWLDDLEPHLHHLGDALDANANALQDLLELFDDVVLPETRMPPLLTLRRAMRRLSDHAGTTRAMLDDRSETARWVEADRHRDGGIYASLNQGPIHVAPSLKRILWDKLPGTAATSATLTVAKRFGHWKRRVGIDPEAAEDLVESPFEHASQAVLAIVRDMPEPNTADFLRETSAAVVAAVQASGGGAFVLCTSYDAVHAYTTALKQELPASWTIIHQSRGASRPDLLRRFRDAGNAVLVGTDSFWEGVDVRGDALRLVIVPRLPFRVPTDPLHQARHERIAANGGDPFKAYTLPEAIIKLKQGYGRLIRSQTDRGVVLLLDRRLHGRSYGRIMLSSLPPARRVNAPWRRVHDELQRFFAER